MPEMFKDSAFAKTSHWEMSTSSLVSEYLDGWGYGEGTRRGPCALSCWPSIDPHFFLTATVVEDGYGLAYSVGVSISVVQRLTLCIADSSFSFLQDSYLRWVITSRKDMKAKELRACLEWACLEVKAMMERAAVEAGKKETKAKL